MVQYRYLGYGITNSDGVAKLDHDAQGNPVEHSYVGTGAGKVDLVASLDDVITESSFVSETFELLDCIKYDYGTQSNHNDIWSGNNVTITRESDCTVIHSNAQWGTASLTGIPDLLANNDIICIEFEMIGTHVLGTQGFNIRYTNNGANAYLNASDGTGNAKIYVSNNRFVRYFNGTKNGDYTNLNIPNCYLQSVANASGLDVKYRDLKIYPVSSFP